MAELTVRRVRYSVAMSLDGFIADRAGGYDWIVEEPGIDFGAYLAKIDTLIMGRGTYEIMLEAPGGLDAYSGMEIYVVSTTLEPHEVPDATLITEDVEEVVRALKNAADGRSGGAGPPGEREPSGSGDAPPKDIWLFGGGVLFRSLLEAGLVDRVEVGVVPVLLGAGIPLLPGLGHPPGARASVAADDSDDQPPPVAGLRLHSCETFDSGMVLLKYDVEGT